ncbi:hypothetical protein SAMN05421760_11529 [Neptunomonas antarctica]|uniref:Uncharacterized protein n=2 Tax=Neptunomonas antarctica TaxID=619304 RepID=A0A1N7PIH3_9GAMM|nr:hypothetical protein SAMN05421760_11529 [Neptunomonas antarctica]
MLQYLAYSMSLAHSTGNRVLRETLSVWDKYDLPQGVPLIFMNTFLVAVDVINETLHEGQKGEPGKVFEHIFSCLLSGRVYCDDDNRRSSIIHLGKKE